VDESVDADFTRIKIDCNILACDLRSFHESVRSPVCKLPLDKCSERYSNLNPSGGIRGSKVRRSKRESIKKEFIFHRGSGKYTGSFASSNAISYIILSISVLCCGRYI